MSICERVDPPNTALAEGPAIGSGSALKSAVLPFSKRPPPPDDYSLNSGDFEIVRQPTVWPPAPAHQVRPAPVFARQAAPAPYGSYGHAYPAQPAYVPPPSSPFGHRMDLSAPPPPHSLAPVAMGQVGADTSGPHSISYTNRTYAPVASRRKPNLTWGIMIAATGALLGGVLGLGMDAHRQAAAAAANRVEANAPAIVATALPNAVLVAPAAPVVPRVAPVVPRVAPAPAVVLRATQPVIVAPSRVAPAAAPQAVKPRAVVAARVTPPKQAAAPRSEAPAKPEPRIVKADPKPTKAESAESGKKDATTTDAMKILEAANKDTANTL
jgi:hypothetical protein